MAFLLLGSAQTLCARPKTSAFVRVQQNLEASMEPNDIKTASELAAEAARTADEAGQAAQGYVSESKRIVREAAASIRPSVGEFKQLAAEAADTTGGLAHDAHDLSRDAMRSVGGYAARSLRMARDQMLRLSGQMEDGTNACRQYVASNPMKAALAAVATGALLMTLARHAVKGRGRA